MDFLNALDEIEKTKGINKEELISAVEAALISAYKKDYRGEQNVRVEINRETGVLKVFSQKEVVEEVTDEMMQISLAEAHQIHGAYQIGDIVELEIDPKGFGRMAAQNAKQLILQRIKEAERNLVYDTFAAKKGELITCMVTRVEHGDVYVELGKYEGVMNQANQIPTETYFQGMRIKVCVLDVSRTNKGSMIFVSRSNVSFVRRLFEREIPEIFDGLVEIKSIARDAGSRTKIAVGARESDIDAVGACIGLKGTRIQNILNELGEEKIDVIEFKDDPAEFIKNALSPAKTEEVIIDETIKAAVVIVSDDQLSLAIGAGGQNVRLAAKLTGYRIDIKNREQYEQLLLDRQREMESYAEMGAEMILGDDAGYDDTDYELIDETEDME